MNSYGENIRLTIFGASHAPSVGMVLDGVPAGEPIDRAALQRFLDRRAPGRNSWSTARRETDAPDILSGIVDGRTSGAPIAATLRNSDARREDQDAIRDLPRPGHADFSAWAKYGEQRDISGGGPFSGRMTAPLCIAGGICLQILGREEITVISRIAEIGGIEDAGDLDRSTAEKEFPVIDDDRGAAMRDAIACARAEGDSLGGIVECAVLGLPAGLGGPLFEGLESRIANICFAIPAVKGIEFGAGFGAARLRGSENNDPFVLREGRVETSRNACGGILGGISTGMPLRFRVAFKPTPSIAKEQDTVDLRAMCERKICVSGRHDPCVVPRAVPVVEAAAAIVIYDALLARKKELGRWT